MPAALIQARTASTGQAIEPASDRNRGAQALLVGFAFADGHAQPAIAKLRDRQH